MNIKIFDINESAVTINENCLLIPELKEIVDTYENPIPALTFVYYMTDPMSPYANLNPEEREQSLLEDYPGDYTTDDEPIYKALNKLSLLYETPTMRLLRQAKVGLTTLGNYLEKASITDGKDSNSATFQSALKSIGKISLEFRQLEQAAEDELKARGSANIGYDEV